MKTLTTETQFTDYCSSKFKQHVVAVTNAMSKVLLNWTTSTTKGRKTNDDTQLTLAEFKLLWFILSSINWRNKFEDGRIDFSKGYTSNKVILSVKDIASELGWGTYGEEQIRKLPYRVKDQLISLKAKSSTITISDLNNKGSFICASLFGNIIGDSEKIGIEINPIFMPYLAGFMEGGFYYDTYWREDIANLKTLFGCKLYIAMKLKFFQEERSDYFKEVKTIGFGTKELKSAIFECKKEDYTTKVKGKDKFQRTAWERKQVLVACKDINENCKYIKILPSMDEKGKETLFTKSYKGKGKVDQYLFDVKMDHPLMNKGRFYFEEEKDKKPVVFREENSFVI